MKKLYRTAAGALLAALIVLVTTASAAVFANPTPITINDRPDATGATPYPSTIGVAGLSGTVTDVNVTLTGFGHTFPDDVDILLVGPTGANTLLMSDACGFVAMSGVNLVFDDAEAATLPDSPGAACTSGSYKPTNYGAGDIFPAPAPSPSATVFLANFHGTAPNGTWSLYVVDDDSGDTGTIAGGWSLSITTTMSPPTSFANPATITINDRPAVGSGTPYPSTIGVAGLSGTVTDVNVTLTGFSHTFPTDVDILLAGPGANTLLMSDACGSPDMSGVNLSFDDAAGGTLPDTPVGSPCTSGSYKPTNYGTGDIFLAPAPAPSATVALANFNGTAPNGTWSLYVVDDTTPDPGTISGGWSLEVITTVPTAVEVTGLRAARVAGGVELRWRTASEVDVAGFDVYRDRTKLNRAPIAAKRAGTARGASYRLLDRSARPGGSRVYRLQLVRPDGRRSPAGTVALLASK